MNPGPRNKNKVRVFFSYSHRDEDLRGELETHLAVLRHEGTIEAWHDRKVTAGNDWAGEINAHLSTADIILLLLSPDFLASPYCYDIEMVRAMERNQAGKARVIPVILRACDWTHAPFGNLQALPKDAKPVRRWEDRDEAFLDIAAGIRKAIREMITARAGSPAPGLDVGTGQSHWPNDPSGSPRRSANAGASQQPDSGPRNSGPTRHMPKRDAIRQVNGRCKPAILDNGNTRFANINTAVNAWWFHIPPSMFERDGEAVHMLLYDRRSDEFHYLKVPRSYFRENLSHFVVRRDGARNGTISLTLSTDTRTLFQDTHQSVPFEQFLQPCAGAKSKSRQ
jgi:hypothetical protein